MRMDLEPVIRVTSSLVFYKPRKGVPTIFSVPDENSSLYLGW
jgi:hypothetical protein